MDAGDYWGQKALPLLDDNVGSFEKLAVSVAPCSETRLPILLEKSNLCFLARQLRNVFANIAQKSELSWLNKSARDIFNQIRGMQLFVAHTLLDKTFQNLWGGLQEG